MFTKFSYEPHIWKQMEVFEVTSAQWNSECPRTGKLWKSQYEQTEFMANTKN